ncbi:short chain dehydrogenase family protein [Hyaloraphidium curvatum]|nr:short chain dehydrogenase family protein [Hyaloraphidium curvatum]
MSLANTVAVITGSASGIGLASAREFARLGADLVLGDLDAAALSAAKDSLLSSFPYRRVQAVVCDVSSDAGNAALAAAAVELGGKVSILMLNAGVGVAGRLELIPAAEWERTFAVNVLGTVRGLAAFMPLLSEGSRVVVTGSSASFTAGQDGSDAPYTASKHALLGLVKSYANYLGRKGVSVQLLAPKLTDTGFLTKGAVWTSDGRKNTRVAVPEGTDTAEQVARMMVRNLGNGKLVISADPGLPEAVARFAREQIAAVDPKL